MKCIINGKFVLGKILKEGLAIVFDKKIEKIVRKDEIDLAMYQVIDAKGNIVAPGLVDMHIHGYLGCDASDGDERGLKTMAEGIVKNGVTSFCPTTMTLAKADIEKAFDTSRKLKGSDTYYGAKIIGINSEGPFINPSKKGAQAEEHILAPDADFIINNKDIVKLFTVAPEVEGALCAIEKVRKNTDVLICMGHTAASYEQALAGIEKGVRNTTHLFNAMTPLSHRSPGVVGAALSNDEVYTELIADTFHVDKGLFSLIAKLKGDKLCLITDCIRAGGMPDGDYTLGGQPVRKEGIKCLMPDGTIAGSVLTLNKAVYNLYKSTDLSLPEAFAAATENPASALGVNSEIGSLERGKSADIIIASPELDILMTIIDGEIRYKGENI